MNPEDLSPNSAPAFLDPVRANSIGYIGAEGTPNFDHELVDEHSPALAANDEGGPSRGYRERWRMIARLVAMGKRQKQICEELGYSQNRLSNVLKSEWIQSEIARYRQQYDADIATQVKEAATDGIHVIHRIINSDAEKSQTRLDAAKWAVEKAHGKARQEVTVESGTLSSFIGMLREMRERREVIEVTALPALPESNAPDATDAVAPPPADRFDAWLDKHIP